MMTFKASLRTVYVKKYAKLEGRASRAEYWWFQLFLGIIAVVLTAPAMYFWYRADPGIAFENIPTVSWLFFALLAIFGLASFIPQICVSVRRFHDRNLSGWWYLAIALAGYIPYIGFAADIASLVITILRGQPGRNRFGPDPLNPVQDDLSVFE